MVASSCFAMIDSNLSKLFRTHHRLPSPVLHEAIVTSTHLLTPAQNLACQTSWKVLMTHAAALSLLEYYNVNFIVVEKEMKTTRSERKYLC